MSQFSIKVDNRSGMHQKFVIFSAKPRVEGPVDGGVWQVAFDQINVPDGGSGTFNMGQYSVVCGNSNGRLGEGSRIEVSGSKSVTLGKNGSPGSSFSLEADEGYAQLGQQGMNGGEQNSFAIAVGDNQSQLFTGFGIGDKRRPAVVFIPQSRSRCQLSLVNTFFVVRGGQWNVGSIANIDKGDGICKVDFDQLNGRKDSVVVLNESGQFQFQE